MQFSTPVIKSSTYIELEKTVLKTEEKVLEAMEKVSLLFLEKITQFLSNFDEPPVVVLLVGKGNNGADALTIGRHLIKAGVKVFSLEFFEEGSSLFQLQREKFYQARGERIDLESFFLIEDAVLIDGVFGSGFKGPIDERIAEIFDAINQLHHPILSLDTPSGVSGDKGAFKHALIATETYYIDFPRYGFFLDEAPNHIGRLVPIFLDCVSFEMIENSIEGYLIKTEDLTFPELKRKRHKYQAGSLVGWCGSKGMSGALNLSGLAALRSGAGICKFVHHQKLSLTVPELILFPLEKAKKLMRKASVFFAGPGTKKKLLSKIIFRVLLKFLNSPLVVDADATYWLSKKLLKKIKHDVVITPHHRECTDLLDVCPQIKDEELFKKIEEFMDGLPHYFVLKGLPTVIFSSNHPKLFIYGGDPGMATAGSGDVLTGMIASFIAQKMKTIDAICLATFLHQRAGEIAAIDKTSYGVIASDLIERIPDAILSLFLDSEDDLFDSDTTL